MKITVCGSIAFYKNMEEVKSELEKNSHEVKIPLLSNEVPEEMGGGREVYFGKYIEDNGGMEAFPVGHKIWDLKGDAILDHYNKIKWADGILVTNYEKRGIKGYVGGNTLIEMGVAFFLKKPIYILNEVSSELSYKQEILGMKPIVLGGDLNSVKFTGK